jgi:hypothetical protein
MANGNGLVQRAPLPPLNSPIINEADRTRVYGAIGKELNNILNGATSYYSDSVKKSSMDLMSELNDFIGAVQSLRDVVNDPGNILGDAVRDLKHFGNAFSDGVDNDIETMWNDSNDMRDNGIKLPDDLAPTTEDHNVIYVDPAPQGQFSVPNPLSLKQWPKALNASIGSSNDVAVNGAPPDIYPRLGRRVANPAPGSINSVNAKQSPTVPPSQIEGISEALNNQPVRRFSRINGNNPPASAFDTGAPATQFVLPDNPGPLGGLVGRIAAMAGIDPRNPDRLVPPPGGLLGLYLSGLR